MPGIPAHASRVRVEVDASDVSNLLANHSGQSGATTGWSADTGVTLAAVTDPTRSGETLLGDYTGGKCIKATYDGTATITSQVYGPSVTVTAGTWVSYQFSLADSRLVDLANPLQVVAYVEFLDASSAVLGASGSTRQLLSGDDPWQMVDLQGGYQIAPAGTASARVKLRFSDNGTTKITRDVYLAKVMMVTGGSLQAVYGVAFSDAAEVWQDVTGAGKSIQIRRGGRVSGVVDEMDAGTLTAIIADPYVDPAQNDRMRAGRKVRVTALDSTATWRTLFTGRIDQLDVDYVDKSDPSANPEVTITAVDAIAEMRNVQQPFNYAGAYGPKVKALMAADTNITYTADAGTASTDINHRDRDNGRLWDQLVLARNSFAGAQLWIDQDGELQAVTVSPTGTPAYGFSDEAAVTLTNLETNPSFESSATIDYFLNGGTGPISFAQSLAWSVDGTYSCLVSKDDTTASFFYLGYQSSPWAASYGDWFAYTITVKAVIDCRVRLARDQYKPSGLSLGVLETANLTAGDVHTFTGTTQLLYDAAMTGVKIYLDVEQPGGGAFTVSGDIIYVDQMAVYNTGSTELASVPYYATTGVYPPMTPYIDVEVKFGTGVLCNELSITLNNDGETDGAKEYGPYRNAASQADWGVQSATVQAIDGTAPSTLAAAFLALYATPTIFPRGVTFRWKDAYGDAVFVDLYDEVQVRHAPSNTDQVVTVLGVEHTITPKRWDVTLTLRPQGSESITVTNPAAGADTGPDDVAGAPAPTDFVRRSDVPINATDPAYGLTGTTDNTTAIQAGLTAATAASRGFHFGRRSGNDPYVIGGSGVLLQLASGIPITADPGVVLKVKSSNGDYKAMIGGTSSSTDLSGLTIDGLTFDQNTSGNAVSDVATLLVSGTQRFVVYVGAGDGITVRSCRFQNIDGLNVVYIGSATSKDARIQDCEFDLVGTSPAWHDHSSVYTSCDGATITGNKFRGILGSNGATTAIETHGPNQVVQGNRIDGYKIGANVTGITNIGNDGISIAGNVIRNALIGVQLWSQTGTNDGLVDVEISHNRIHLDRDPWTLASTDHPRGICLAQAATGGGTLDNIDGLQIVGNLIRFGSFSTSESNDYQNASGIELVSTGASVEVQNFDIGDNIIIGAIGPAMRIGLIMRRGKIHDNHWVDPSSTTQTLGTPAGFTTFWRSGLCATGNADFYDVRLWGNRTFDTRGTHLLSQGWATSLSTTGVTRCEEWDNTVICSDGTILPGSSQTTGKFFTARGVTVAPRYKTGLYHTPQGGAPVTSFTMTQSRGYFVAFPLASTQAFSQIAANLVTAGVASTVLRFGVYLDDGQGAPGALLADFGTVAADGTLGSRPVTISQTLQQGWVWLAIVAQGGAPVVTGQSGWLVGSSGATSVAGAITARSAYYQDGVTGALPTFSSSGQIANWPAIFLKA